MPSGVASRKVIQSTGVTGRQCAGFRRWQVGRQYASFRNDRQAGNVLASGMGGRKVMLGTGVTGRQVMLAAGVAGRNKKAELRSEK